jgi:hypothetical protein
LCFALAGVAAQAQEDGIKATISAQLDALEAGNFSTAFSYASPMIRGRFGTAANFAEMVARGYGVMLRPVEVTFLERRKAGSGHWQRVMLRAADGAVVLFDYEMLPARMAAGRSTRWCLCRCRNCQPEPLVTAFISPKARISSA